jgi:hypothetical protein
LASILVISLLILVVGRDVIFIPEQKPYQPPSYLTIREVDVRPLDITDSYVDINITAYLNHVGSETNNASMIVRAINRDAGLLISQGSTSIPETEFDKTISVYQNLRIDRDKNYELRIFLFDNGSVQDSGTISVQGLSILTPKSKDNKIVLNNIDFIVSGVDASRVSINPDIYLENTGPEISKSLNIIVKAREADSNLLADKITSQTGEIKSEATVIKTVQLKVPDKYNYMIVVELWNDDILTNTWERPVLLAPTKTLPKESQEKKVNIEVSKFVREGQTGVAMPVPTSTPPLEYTPAMGDIPGTKKEPGFEIIIGIIAILSVLIYRRYRYGK